MEASIFWTPAAKFVSDFLTVGKSRVPAAAELAKKSKTEDFIMITITTKDETEGV